MADEKKWAHEWVAKRDNPDMRCRICGTLKWKTGADEQPPCEGDVRIIEGQAVQVVREKS